MLRDFTLSTRLILDEAKKRGIKKKIISLESNAVEFDYKGHKEYLRGQVTSNNSAIAYNVCGNKNLTRLFLERAKIRVPMGRQFLREQKKEALAYIRKMRGPVVLKPVFGTHGKSVYVNVRKIDVAKKIINKICRESDAFLVEEYFTGEEYRIFATRDKLISVVNRIPANVDADGKHTIKELIALKNQDPRRGDAYEKSLLRIQIDDEMKRILKQQKLTLNTVPKKGKRIFLRINSNLSTGGDSYEVTYLIHPSVRKIAKDCIRAVPGLQYAGIDFLTKDITKAQSKNSYAIIEMNYSPMISMHHYPYAGRSSDAAKAIIDLLFPETKKNPPPKKICTTKPVLGIIEKISLVNEKGKAFKVEARMDTGAHFTVLDNTVAKKMGYAKLLSLFKKAFPKTRVEKRNKSLLNKAKKVKQELRNDFLELKDIKIIPATNGFSIRPLVKTSFILKGKEITTEVLFADRKHMRYLGLVGKKDLPKFLISPAKTNNYRAVL